VLVDAGEPGQLRHRVIAVAILTHGDAGEQLPQLLPAGLWGLPGDQQFRRGSPHNEDGRQKHRHSAPQAMPGDHHTVAR
jgi:hypothetical protein